VLGGLTLKIDKISTDLSGAFGFVLGGLTLKIDKISTDL